MPSAQEIYALRHFKKEAQALLLSIGKEREEDQLEKGDPPIYHEPFTEDYFMENSLPNLRMLDVGCGSSARYIPLAQKMKMRYYHGIDAVKAVVDAAQKAYVPNQGRFDGLPYTIECLSLFQVGKRYPKRFGACVVSNVLMTLPRSRLAPALTSVMQALSEGGRGVVYTCYGKGEKRNDFGMPVTLYEPEEMANVLMSAGASKVSVDVMDGMVQALFEKR